MNLASNLIYIGDDKRRGVDRINQLPSRRLYGSYPETAVEEVIEASVAAVIGKGFATAKGLAMRLIGQQHSVRAARHAERH